jgi:DNA (cytosine-5)-methyltransferase 1
MTLTYTDIFCGAGGSSIGLSAAGLELRLAANHWDRAIATHSANFPDADHLCADISNYDMRRLPRTDVLWASPECTWHSPAGGRRRLRAQLDAFEEYVPTDAGVRSRATAFDVIRAAEVHQYKAIVVENVIEFADWPLFDWWLSGFRSGELDYHVQTVCVSSAHIGDGDTNPYAPQWRDRLYIVATAAGVPVPDVQPRPLAWCGSCDTLVRAVQSWKRPDRRRIGKYGAQYVYRCPNGDRCRHQIVEPFVLPAAAAIDWSDLGQRIGDRARPLAAATIRRIRAGLELFAQPYTVPAGGTWRTGPAELDQPMPARTSRETDGLVCPPFLLDRRDYHGADGSRVRSVDDAMSTVTAAGRTVRTLVCPPLGINVNHGGDGGRPYPLDASALPPRTTKIGDAVALPEPFVAMLRANGTPRAVDEPLAAVTTGRNHALTVPPGAFYTKHYNPRGANWGHLSKDVTTAPLGAITAADHHSLVIPYRRGARPRTTGEPLHALHTKDSAALVQAAVEVDDCWFRMLKPREHLRAQRFPDTYTVTGNKGEQTMQAGNAVSANVAQWLGHALAKVLG